MKVLAMVSLFWSEFWVPILATLVFIGGVAGFTAAYRHANNSSERFSVTIIDGCEYVRDTMHGEVPLVHKGNCRNH